MSLNIPQKRASSDHMPVPGAPLSTNTRRVCVNLCALQSSAWKEAANSLEMPGVRRAIVSSADEKLFPGMAQISVTVFSKMVCLSICIILYAIVNKLQTKTLFIVRLLA